MSDDFDALLRALPTLDARQLTALSQRLSALRALSGDAPEPAADEIMVLAALVEALGSVGEVISIAALARQHGIAAFRGKLPDLLAWCASAAPGGSRVQHRALLAHAWGLLYADIAEAGLACSARLLLAHAHRIPSVMDKHYPGYARCGLLGWVVR